MQSIQARLRGALDRFADPAWAPDGWAQLANLAEGATRTAAPGSDLQLAWTRTFAAAARTPEHIATVRGILDRTELLPGLAVDTELRWSLLWALVAVGAAGEVWVQRSGEIARAIAVGLYPDPISDSAVAAADGFLADTSLPPALLLCSRFQQRMLGSVTSDSRVRSNLCLMRWGQCWVLTTSVRRIIGFANSASLAAVPRVIVVSPLDSGTSSLRIFGRDRLAMSPTRPPGGRASGCIRVPSR